MLSSLFSCYFVDKNRRQEHQEEGWGGGEKARKHRHSLSLTSDKQTEDN